MPIVFNSETKEWQLKDASEEEREYLTNFAVQAVKDTLGEAVAQELFRRLVKAQEEKNAFDQVAN
jgi:hypothetical protein